MRARIGHDGPALLLVLLAVLTFGGCSMRGQGMTDAVDRGDHEPPMCHGSGPPAPRAFDVIDRRGHAHEPAGTMHCFDHIILPCAGEMWYALKEDQNLWQVAEIAKVDLMWLIKRNDIQHDNGVRPGLQLIVPSTRALRP